MDFSSRRTPAVIVILREEKIWVGQHTTTETRRVKFDYWDKKIYLGRWISTVIVIAIASEETNFLRPSDVWLVGFHGHAWRSRRRMHVVSRAAAQTTLLISTSTYTTGVDFPIQIYYHASTEFMVWNNMQVEDVCSSTWRFDSQKRNKDIFQGQIWKIRFAEKKYNVGSYLALAPFDIIASVHCARPAHSLVDEARVFLKGRPNFCINLIMPIRQVQSSAGAWSRHATCRLMLATERNLTDASNGFECLTHTFSTVMVISWIPESSYANSSKPNQPKRENKILPTRTVSLFRAYPPRIVIRIKILYRNTH
jgi:hypothetical protein